MVRYVKRFSGIGVSEIWFADKFSFADSFRLAAYMHMQHSAGKMLAVKHSSFTIENDISITGEAILAGFSKTVQVEVKQAEKYGIACSFTNNVSLFATFYNQFAVNRKIDVTSERRLQEMLPFLKITVASQNGIMLAAHSYLTDEQKGIVRLMHAASQRLVPEGDKQLSGRANKLLHYFDMLQFKQQGYTVYDFGGYAKDTTDIGLQGINKFKLSFGGKVVECKNYSSYPYYILKKIAAATGRLGRA